MNDILCHSAGFQGFLCLSASFAENRSYLVPERVEKPGRKDMHLRGVDFRQPILFLMLWFGELMLLIGERLLFERMHILFPMRANAEAY